MRFATILAASITVLAATTATASAADVTVGVTIPMTGPAAALGVPESRAIALAPKTLAGATIKYIVLDDATDPTAATKNAQKLINEDKADIIFGSGTVPTALTVSRVGAEAMTPVLTLAPIKTEGDIKHWTFSLPQPVIIMARALIAHMQANDVKTLAFIGYNDPYGEDWWNNISREAEAAGIKFVASERFGRADTSVIGQTLKIIAAKPDAVLVGASGTPSVLPQATLRERGYAGRIYQTHGSASSDFLRVGGRNVEGTVLPVGPVLVAEQLPDSHPVKAPALEFLSVFEGAHGPASRNTFAAHAWDAMLTLQAALPAALEKATPGTPEFRAALRDAIEAINEMPANHGVYTMSADDHTGLDDRGVVLVKVENGAWTLVQ